MLTSHKLLYILPDVAYIAELLPTKKEHTFNIQSFRQINGEFIDDNDFIAENIKKLINKLDDEEYHLILPDFLFTNTIVEVAETDETKVVAHLKEKLLPELTLSPDTHELKTFVLTNHAGKSKVQLSALEKSLMNPISQNVEEKGIKIKAVSPLSWTIKSIISLEPSISILQMGSRAYLTQHYIGIDQAMSTSVDDAADLAETIKTLKGAEPSIQTVYMITNQLVEEKLKENLSDTLPLQQLASFSEEDSEMPSYVKFGIEAGMKTLSLDAFPVPKFPLPKPSDEVPVAATAETKETEKVEEKKTEEETPKDETTPEPTTEDKIEPITAVPDIDTEASDLPKPDAAPVAAAAASQVGGTAATATVTSAVSELSMDASEPTAPKIEEPENAPTIEAKPEEKEPEPIEKTETTTPEPEKTSKEVTAPVLSLDSDDTKKEKEDEKPEEKKVEKEEEEKESKPETTSKSDDEEKEDKKNDEKKESKEEKKSDVIKNQSGLQPMLKMLGISFLVFLVTVGVGIGVGRAFIYFTQEGATLSQNTPVASATPTPEEEATPTPSPSPEPEVDVTELSVLVVNATTKAGYAGDSADLLDEAEFGDVDAANAKGDYEESGVLVLMEEEDEAIIEAIVDALGEDVTFEEGYDVEDAAGKYDAVIVLTE